MGRRAGLCETCAPLDSELLKGRKMSYYKNLEFKSEDWLDSEISIVAKLIRDDATPQFAEENIHRMRELTAETRRRSNEARKEEVKK